MGALHAELEDDGGGVSIPGVVFGFRPRFLPPGEVADGVAGLESSSSVGASSSLLTRFAELLVE